MHSKRSFTGSKVSRDVVVALTSTVEAMGVRTDELLAEAGLSRRDLEDPELRLPREVVGDLWRRAVKLTGDSSVGLRTAEQLRPGSFDVWEYAVRNLPTLGHAVEGASRYAPLLFDALSFGVRTDGDVARLSYTVNGKAPPTVVSEFVLASLVRLLREGLESPLRLMEVRFAHPAPVHAASLEQFFDAPVRFSASENALCFDAAFLDVRLARADPALRAILERHAERLLSELPKSDTFADRVKATLVDGLGKGEASASAVARALHMSSRTLHRRLQEDGTSHHALLDEVRHQLALRYVGEGQLSKKEIAHALGFSDASAFRKAFKRWTGAAPVGSVPRGSR